MNNLSTIALSWGALSLLCAAEMTVSLPEGDRLTGKLLSIQPNGESSFLPNGLSSPVTLRAGSLRSITFPPTSTPAQKIANNETITLSNGDTIRASLASINDSSVTFRTWFDQEFTLPRDQVTRIDFNTHLHAQEPLSELKWHSNKNWSFLSNTHITSKGPASISLSPELSENCTMEFSLTWETHHPDFTIYFCADASDKEKATDFYRLHFARNKSSLYRHAIASQQKLLGSITTSRNFREPVSQKKVKLEIDRKNKRLALTIDGSRKIFEDHEVLPPLSNHLVIHSAHTDRRPLSVAKVTLSHWHDSLPIDQPLSLSPQPADTDTLIDKEDHTRFAGTLKKITTSNSNKLIHFFSDSRKKELTIPFTHTHRLLFKQNADAPPQPEQPYTITLNDQSTLQLSSLALAKKQVDITHPILGKFSLAQSALSKLSYQPAHQDD